MDVLHVPHQICGRAGTADLTLEYMYLRKFADRPKPVVAGIPGGGWLHGGMKSVANPEDAADLLNAGLICVSIRHRPITEAPFPACRDDVRTALDWIIEYADDITADRDAIALDGGSAGGHLATLTAALEAKHNAPHPVRAVILRGPPMDIARWFIQIADNDVLTGCVRKLLGGTPDEKPDLCKQATPLTHIGPGMPPFLIFHGEKDVAVPLWHTEQLAEKLQAAAPGAPGTPAAPVTRIVVENGTHGLGPNDERGSNPTPEQIAQMKLDFLAEHLPGLPPQ